jgi:SAM-dependent methyltransferase
MPATRYFGGETVRDECFESALYKCFGCHLFFRWPRLEPEYVNDLYRSSDEPYPNTNRKDWRLALDYLDNRTNGKSILDIGCYDGSFLMLLDDTWDRQGVEINSGASQEAQRKGIRIIAKNIDELWNNVEYEGKFDAVTALDVIEHMFDPLLFLKKALFVTKRGGCVLVSTGNTSSLSWRMMGARYWYGLFLAHISFINDDWCRCAAKELSVVIKKTIYFSHGEECSTKNVVLECLKNIIYLIFPGLFSWMRKRGFGGINVNDCPQLADSPPYWKTARDHMMVLFEKPY